MMSGLRSIREGFLLAVLALTLHASCAQAENVPGTVTTGIFLGQIFLDNELQYGDASLVGLSIGYNFDERLAAELSFCQASSNEEAEGADKADAAINIVRLEGLYHFAPILPKSKIVPFLAAGAGVMSFKSDRPGTDPDRDLLLSIGGGLKYFINNGLAIRGDIREVANYRQADDSYLNLMYSVSLVLTFGGPQKEAEPEPVQETASPEPEPETAPPEAVKEAPPADTDKDGVPDTLDKCPGTPPGVKVDASGCPEPEKAVVTARGTYDFGKVYFDFNKTKIKPKSYPVLQNVVDYLNKYPDVKLEVQGHTDGKGTRKYNLKLSGARAMAVRTYLVKKGVKPERLTAKGYGMSVPVATNRTDAGRAKNRRTEFLPIW